MERTLKLCVRCGADDLATPPPGYFVPGRSEVAGIYYCRQCGYVGAPLLVEESKAGKYRKLCRKTRSTV